MTQIIRGAVCAENTAQSIAENAVLLIKEILDRNCLAAKDVSAIFFSATADLNAANPATAVRKQLGLNNVAFMCFQEMTVAGMLPCCIRAAVFTETGNGANPTPVYLGAAAALRPDLSLG